MSNPPQQPTQVWDDEHIESALMWVKHRGLTAGTRIMLKQMRDEYEAKLAQLESQLAESQRLHAECTTSLITADRQIERLKQQLAEAQQWQQMKDGKYKISRSENIEIRSDMLIVWGKTVNTTVLPDNVRLFHRTPVQGGDNV